MKNELRFRSIFPVMLLALVVSLAGCSDAGQAPSPTATTQAQVTTAVTGQTGDASPTAVAAASATANPTAIGGTGACAKLNLNTLTEDQLMATIPGFSSRMAREFQEYRPYDSIQQFRREIGKYVDAAQVTDYEKYVFVPVDPNAADSDTLKQIPGVDDAAAATLIQGRPYATNEAFLQTLEKSVSAQQLPEASCYLVTK